MTLINFNFFFSTDLIPSSFTDIQAVLLTDMLLLLQEKDQKFVFAAVVSFTILFFLCQFLFVIV